jgi:hypothetical protein
MRWRRKGKLIDNTPGYVKVGNRIENLLKAAA